jgi:TfoX/Sxy family transcriptional regulator of competence genes
MTMEYDLVAAIRSALAGVEPVHEVKMFGGIGFMLNGNLVAAASKRGLLLRVGKERQGDVLTQSGAHVMEMRGRVMEGYVFIDPPALTDAAVQAGVRIARAFVETLPPKPTSPKPVRMKGKRR